MAAPKSSNGSSQPDPQSARAHEVRRALARLRGLAARLDHQASLIRSGSFNPRAEAEAGCLAADAFAIRWALRRIAPETEAVAQVFGALNGIGGSPR